MIIAVPNDKAMPFDVLPFSECISMLVVAGMPDCNKPIPIQKSISSFLKIVRRGVAMIAEVIA